jgi:hypothetical protein
MSVSVGLQTTTDGTTARSVAEKRSFPDVLRVLVCVLPVVLRILCQFKGESRGQDARSATASPESSAVTTPTLSTQTAVGFSARCDALVWSLVSLIESF